MATNELNSATLNELTKWCRSLMPPRRPVDPTWSALPENKKEKLLDTYYAFAMRLTCFKRLGLDQRYLYLDTALGKVWDGV